LKSTCHFFTSSSFLFATSLHQLPIFTFNSALLLAAFQPAAFQPANFLLAAFLLAAFLLAAVLIAAYRLLPSYLSPLCLRHVELPSVTVRP
jgi:hypothetical protein